MGGTVSGASDTEGSSARHSGVKIKRKIGRVLAFQGVTHWGPAALFPVRSCVFPRAGLSCQPRASLPGPQPRRRLTLSPPGSGRAAWGAWHLGGPSVGVGCADARPWAGSREAPPRVRDPQAAFPFKPGALPPRGAS